MSSAGSGSDGLNRLFELIDSLDDLVHQAKAVPMTDQVRVDKMKLYALLDHMRAAVPGAVQRPQPAPGPPPATGAFATPLAPPPDIDLSSADSLLAALEALDDAVHNAKHIPLTDDRRISAEHFYELIDRARAQIPDAVKMARWLLAEHRALAGSGAPARQAGSDPDTGMAEVDLNLALGLDEPPSG